MSLLQVRNLKTYFPVTGGVFGRIIGNIKAVDEVSLNVEEQEIVSVVGESGCGKTTLGLSILGLVPVTSGEIAFSDDVVDTGKPASWARHRRNYQIIFQDPFTSLNPRHTIFDILSEPMLLHGICSRRDVRGECVRLMQQVGLSPDYLDRFPHAFSGGQRQRIAIARAIGVRPAMIVCDEVVSALDVSVQAQIIQLLLDLKREMKLSLFFIAHDLSLVKSISDRIYVMYLGKIVESARPAGLFSAPRHPYTAALLRSIPTLDRSRKPQILGGEVPSPAKVPPGCVFKGRCPRAQEKCNVSHPPLERESDRRQVACYYPL
ncbi:MAG: ATP-binding cassette domain-containing protein [Chitinivibrionales bacterium]|nr:ATP-binding cassette domain-containing protein [Chitinivibrionales bacterium]